MLQSSTFSYYITPSHLYYFDRQILYLIDRLLDNKVSIDNLRSNITQCLQEYFMNQSNTSPPYSNFDSFLQFDKYLFNKVFRDNDYQEGISIIDNNERQISNINMNDIDNTIRVLDFNILMNNQRKAKIATS